VSEVATRNEELVRHIIDLHNEGADAILGELEDLFDPEVKWTPIVIGGLEGGTYAGYDGLRRFYADRGDTFREGRLDVIGCEPVGENHVVAHLLSSGVGRASGARIEHEIWIVYGLRDGRVLREWGFTSRSEAMEVAGA
jgi:hypothetical protein